MEMTLEQEAMKEAKEIWEKELGNNFKTHVNNCSEKALRNLYTNLEELKLSMKTHLKEEKLKKPKNPFYRLNSANNNQPTQQAQNMNDPQFMINPFGLAHQPQVSQQNQDIDDILRKKMGNSQSLKLLTIPNYNPLINLVLYCLVNFKPLRSLYLNHQNEQYINRSPNYLGPALLKLFDYYWKSDSKEYSTEHIHKAIQRLLQNNYFSYNFGLIFEKIISQLRNEISSPMINNIYIDNNSYNYTESLKNLKRSFDKEQNMILHNTSYSILDRMKQCSNCSRSFQFFFEINPIINIYLNKGSNNYIDMMQSLNDLLLDNSQQTINEYCNFCKSFTNKRIASKGIIHASNLIIFNIIRAPYQNNCFNYTPRFSYQNIIKKNDYFPVQNINYDLIAIFRKVYFNNNQQIIVYIKNFVNGKWYAYNNKEIIEEQRLCYDGLNDFLLVYQGN